MAVALDARSDLRALQRAVEGARARRAVEEARRRAVVTRITTFHATSAGRLGILWRILRTEPLSVLRWLFVSLRRVGGRRGAASAIALGEAATGERRYEDAVARFDEALNVVPASLAALRGKRAALAKMGELTALLDVVHQLQAIGDLGPLRRAARLLEGRLRELDPLWLPEVGARPSPLEPVTGRVLHLLKHSLPQHTNGYSVRSHATLLAQRSAGLDPFVVTGLGQSRAKDGSLAPDTEVVDGIVHHRLDIDGNFPVDDLPVDEVLSLSAAMIAPIVAQTRPEILHARSGFRGYDGPLVALALGRHFDLPVVYEASMFLEGTWTDDPDRMERGELFEKRSAQEIRCMRDADHVVTIADSMRDEIIARGIPPERVTVIPNGVDPERFQPAEPDLALAERLGLRGKTVFGYVSNLGKREGVHILIEAVAELRARGRDVGALIVGDGPERARLDAMVADLGLGDRVALTGAVPHDEVPAMYALIDVFVIPRMDERAARLVTPLKPYEAMALGKPLLVADLPALVEVAAPDERGLAFRAEDPRALADAAERFLDDPTLGPRLGAVAREWVLRERTWDMNGPRYLAVYEAARKAHLERRSVSLPLEVDRLALERELALLLEAIDEAKQEADEAQRGFVKSRFVLAAMLLGRARALTGKRQQLAFLVSVWKKSRKSPSATALSPGQQPRIATHAAVRRDGRLPERQLADRAGDGSFLELGRRAIAQLDRVDPILLAYYPLARSNPYQALLYSRSFEEGVATLPIADLDALEDAPALRALGATVWAHLHWLAPVLQDARDGVDARARIDAFLAKIDAARQAGVRVAWTVHNVLPHDSAFPDEEIRLRIEVLERCDVVHCLGEDTPAIAAPLFKIPEDLVEVVPHPSYLGVYARTMGQRQARLELGLAPEALVVGAFGAILPYKGTSGMLDAFQEAAALDPRLRLVVAGMAMTGTDEIRKRCEADPAIISWFGRVPDIDMQRYLEACDAVLLTHEKVLNSGVAFLAWTFGKPVIAYRQGSLVSLVTPDLGLLIEPSRDALVTALGRVEELRNPSYTLAANAMAATHAPAIVSEMFAAAVRKRSQQRDVLPS